MSAPNELILPQSLFGVEVSQSKKPDACDTVEEFLRFIRPGLVQLMSIPSGDSAPLYVRGGFADIETDGKPVDIAWDVEDNGGAVEAPNWLGIWDEYIAAAHYVAPNKERESLRYWTTQWSLRYARRDFSIGGVAVDSEGGVVDLGDALAVSREATLRLGATAANGADMVYAEREAAWDGENTAWRPWSFELFINDAVIPLETDDPGQQPKRELVHDYEPTDSDVQSLQKATELLAATIRYIRETPAPNTEA